MTSISNNGVPVGVAKNPGAISLVCLFQILTGCCIFFACLKISPLLAIAGTIVLTPAIIRTGVASDIFRRSGARFDWRNRIKFFISSICVVMFTIAIASGAFALISLATGLFCVVIVAIVGHDDLVSDVALIGTIGGMLWGAGGGVVAICYSAKKTWPLRIELEKV